MLKGAVRVEDIAPIDEKVDLWSFGVTVYELVTGAIHTGRAGLTCGTLQVANSADVLSAIRLQ